MESGVAARGPKARTKGGQSVKKQRNGTVEVDAAALNRVLGALVAMRDGNFRRRLTVSGDGVLSEIAAVFNEVADRNLHLTGELARVRRVVGREGKLTERLETGACEGSWAAAIDASNELVDDLARPVSEVGRVLSAVADGDLEQRMELRSHTQDETVRPLRGEFLKVARTVNNLVDQLSVFTEQVTRVAVEVGTEGKLGGQAQVRGMSGSWKDLTDSVNTMAYRLTAQVRDIALVTTAVAKGDLSRKVTVHVVRRDAPAQEHREHDGGPAVVVLVRGDARRPRGGYGGRARRSGDRAGRRPRVEGPHRLRQHDGGQPHLPGARHRGGDDGGRQRRPDAEGHGERARRGRPARRDDQPDDRDAAHLRGRGDPRGERGRRRGAARGARRRSRGPRERGRTSPIR